MELQSEKVKIPTSSEIWRKNAANFCVGRICAAYKYHTPSAHATISQTLRPNLAIV